LQNKLNFYSNMGKKRVTTKEGAPEEPLKAGKAAEPKKKISSGVLNIQATFNNTIVTLADKDGNVIASSSSGSMGFKGTKKGTPFAASKVGDFIGEKAQAMGIKEVEAVIRGVGPGRESALRSFMGKGIEITAILDTTPVPHNGPKPKKRRRV